MPLPRVDCNCHQRRVWDEQHPNKRGGSSINLHVNPSLLNTVMKRILRSFMKETHKVRGQQRFISKERLSWER
jgi:hypothetical protein